MTIAYNAEKTIRRTIESVLKQTYDNITYYIRDNGSTDNTYAICKEYANNDKRIILVHSKVNNVYGEDEKDVKDATKGLYYGTLLGKDDFFCLLDADDEYLPDFFEKGVSLANNQNLDIVIGGTEFIQQETGEKTLAHTYETDWLIYGQDFSNLFRKYHWHVRQVWGKLYRKHALLGGEEYMLAWYGKELKEKAKLGLSYGADTITALYYFSRAKRVGVLKGCHHRYYEHKKSVSHRFHPNRVASDSILYRASCDYLMEKCGFVSEKNEHHLKGVYYNAIQDTLEVIFNAHMPMTEKLNNINEIFKCQNTQELLSDSLMDFKIDVKQIPYTVLVWILQQKECRRQEIAEQTADTLCHAYPELRQWSGADRLTFILQEKPELILYLCIKEYEKLLEALHAWNRRDTYDNPVMTELELAALCATNRSDQEIFAFMIEAREKRPVSFEKLQMNIQVIKLMQKYPLLKNMSFNLVLALANTIQWILANDLDKAMQEFLNIDELELNDRDAEAYIMFGQNFSALQSNTELFLYFKKLWILFLADHNQMDKACAALAEFSEFFAQDEELEQVRRYLDASTK